MKKWALLGFLILPFLGISQEKIEKQTFTYKDTLQIDFYSVKEKTNTNRPLLVLVHGGGFSSGKRDGIRQTAFCEKMAANGYAVASINYRLTRKNKSFSCDCPTEDKIDTFIKASEDVTDALLFLHKESETLLFNKNKTVLIGSSAGAEAILNTAFMLDDYRFKHIAKTPVAGIVSFSGAMLNTDYINQKNAIPTLFFHGVKDNLVPYTTAPHHYCDTDEEGYLILYGAKSIADKLQELNTSYILAFDPEGKHEWSNIAFEKTDIIHYFVEEIILKQKFIQLTYKLE